MVTIHIKKRKGFDLEEFNNSKVLINPRMIWTLFMEMLKNAVQIWNVKTGLYLMIRLRIFSCINNLIH